MAKTVLSASATFNNKSGIDNIVLKAKPVISGNEVTIQKSEFKDIELPASQSDHLASSIVGINGWKKTRLVIKDCEFAANERAYNAMELNAELADGTNISNNNFGLVCTHNIINIYDVEDGATIDINDNIFAKAANGIRIGVKGSKSATINIKRNAYNSTDSGEYAGLLLIQPYGKATVDMGGIVINLDDTVNNSGEEQLWYYYAGMNDTQLPVEKRPKVYINGVLQKYADENDDII